MKEKAIIIEHALQLQEAGIKIEAPEFGYQKQTGLLTSRRAYGEYLEITNSLLAFNEDLQKPNLWNLEYIPAYTEGELLSITPMKLGANGNVCYFQIMAFSKKIFKVKYSNFSNYKIAYGSTIKEALVNNLLNLKKMGLL